MKVGKEHVKRIIEKLKKLGGEEESPQKGVAARFRFKDTLVQVYKTGSITFGGKGKVRTEVEEAIADEVVKEMEFPIIGCDEAGKGEFFGPLVVSCVWANKENYKKLLKLGVKDSKGLDRNKIEDLARRVKEICSGRVRVLMPKEYNKLYKKFKNQNRLLEELYIETLRELLKKRKAKVIYVDKFSEGVEERLKKAFPSVKFHVITKGENEPIVAAAAVVAKAERLKRLRELSKELGFEVPEGNIKNRELLRKIPQEKRYRFLKEHFNVEG